MPSVTSLKAGVGQVIQATLDFNQRDLGHGASETVLHPLVALGCLIAIVVMLRGPRKYSVVPLCLCIFLVPRGQEILLLGAHFYVRIILILAGFVNVVRDRFKIAGGLNTIDKLVIVWASYRVFAAMVTNWPSGAMEQLAFLLQVLCGYFLFRNAIRKVDDIALTTKTLAVIAMVLGLCMLYEHHFRENPFGVLLGGAPTVPEIRNGTARAQASFGHAILAGCFGATLIPLFTWLWKRGDKSIAAVGIIGSTLMVLAANSATPLLAYAAGILGLLIWPVRRKMKAVRWGIGIILVLLAMVMNAPVWFVIAHINLVGGGGYDRAFLIDTCVRHFKEWWLIGTNQNGNWGYDMWDMSDQFVAEAETGGILTLVCFVAIITKCFERLGAMRRQAGQGQQWLLWCLGSVMLAHMFAYFGVAYWDQTQMWWLAFLAMISAAVATPVTARVENNVIVCSMAFALQEPKETAQTWWQCPR